MRARTNTLLQWRSFKRGVMGQHSPVFQLFHLGIQLMNYNTTTDQLSSSIFWCSCRAAWHFNNTIFAATRIAQCAFQRINVFNCNLQLVASGIGYNILNRARSSQCVSSAATLRHWCPGHTGVRHQRWVKTGHGDTRRRCWAYREINNAAAVSAMIEGAGALSTFCGGGILDLSSNFVHWCDDIFNFSWIGNFRSDWWSVKAAECQYHYDLWSYFDIYKI